MSSCSFKLKSNCCVAIESGTLSSGKKASKILSASLTTEHFHLKFIIKLLIFSLLADCASRRNSFSVFWKSSKKFLSFRRGRGGGETKTLLKPGCFKIFSIFNESSQSKFIHQAHMRERKSRMQTIILFYELHA